MALNKKMKPFQFAIALSLCLFELCYGDHSDSGDPLDWLRDSIPGEPGVDYPIFSETPDTSFSCTGRIFGGENLNYSVIESEAKKNSPILYQTLAFSFCEE